MLGLINYLYDITRNERPETSHLDEEIDRLLFLRGVEEPNYLVKNEDRDRVDRLDSERIMHWLRRKMEPALLLYILEAEENYPRAKAELNKMERYNTTVEKMFRARFVKDRAKQRLRQLLFEESEVPSITKATKRLKRAMTFLSKHLETSSKSYGTLQDTDKYTDADILLYKYLKRIIVGKYRDQGAKAHLEECDPLVQFMSRYASKNTFVNDVTVQDALASDSEPTGLIYDMTTPALVVMGLMLFFSWRHNLLN